MVGLRPDRGWNMRESLQIELRELRYLEVFCSREGCGVGVLLDMGSPTQGYPEKCPSCGAPFDGSGFLETLSKFKDFYRGLSGSKTKPIFRLTAEEPD